MKQNIILLIEGLVLYGILYYVQENNRRIGRETAQIQACTRVHAPKVQTFGFVMEPKSNNILTEPRWDQ